jgi:predicted nucleic acid-binding protein
VRDGQIATCGPVRIELLQTTRDETEFDAMREALDELRIVAVGAREWSRAEDVFFELASLGPLHHRHVKLADLLVAAAAEHAGMPVLHYDRHFELIASITGQPVRALAPLGSL